MTVSLLVDYVHLVAAVAFVGYTLFWAVIAVSLERRFDRAEAARLLRAVRASRWPNVAVPPAARLPLPLLGWGFLLVLGVTGASLGIRGGGVFSAKLALVALLVVAQAALTAKPGRGLALANLAAALAVVGLSALPG